MTILFASPDWNKYKKALEQAFHKYRLDFSEVTTNLNTNPDSVEFMIYSPDSTLRDFSAYQNLKAVLNLWAGVDTIVHNKTLTQPLIRLVDTGMRQGMLEWCTAHALRHHLSIDTHITQQDGIWRSNFSPPLAFDRKIGILGLGSLGHAVAEALQKIGFDVHGWSQTKKTLQNIRSHYGSDGMLKILQVSEILILLLPLTPSTKFIINKSSLALLPTGAVIINPGRGELINEQDLINSLDMGDLAHATLDVFASEPLISNHPYWSHPKVTVTPHIAARTYPNSGADTIASSIVQIRNGKQPIGLVNPKTFY